MWRRSGGRRCDDGRCGGAVDCVVVGLGFWDGVVAGLGEGGGSHGLGEGGGSQGLGEGGGGHGLWCGGVEAGSLVAAGAVEAGRRRGRRLEIADRARG